MLSSHTPKEGDLRSGTPAGSETRAQQEGRRRASAKPATCKTKHGLIRPKTPRLSARVVLLSGSTENAHAYERLKPSPLAEPEEKYVVIVEAPETRIISAPPGNRWALARVI